MTARKITLWMLVPVGIAYVGRILFESSPTNVRDPYGALWWMLVPVFCLSALVLDVIAIVLAIFAAHKAKHPLPALVLISGLLLVPFLPLPPLPQPVFPEEVFFHEHRAEFEQVIELVRQNQLVCPAYSGCSVPLRDLPPQYAELTQEGTISVLNANPFHLQVKFYPADVYYPIVYFAAPQDRDTGFDSECNSGMRWDKKLDEHWYLCVEQWM